MPAPPGVSEMTPWSEMIATWFAKMLPSSRTDFSSFVGFGLRSMRTRCGRQPVRAEIREAASMMMACLCSVSML